MEVETSKDHLDCEIQGLTPEEYGMVAFTEELACAALSA